MVPVKLNEVPRIIWREIDDSGVRGAFPADVEFLREWQPEMYNGRGFTVGFSLTRGRIVWLTVASYGSGARCLSSRYRTHVHIDFGGELPIAPEAILLARLMESVAHVAAGIDTHLAGRYFDRPQRKDED